MKLRGVDKGEEWLVASEMQEIRDAAKVNALVRDEKTPFLKELSKPGIRKRLMVGVGLMIAQNMVGLNALNYCKPFEHQTSGTQGEVIY